MLDITVKIPETSSNYRSDALLFVDTPKDVDPIDELVMPQEIAEVLEAGNDGPQVNAADFGNDSSGGNSWFTSPWLDGGSQGDETPEMFAPGDPDTLVCYGHHAFTSTDAASMQSISWTELDETKTVVVNLLLPHQLFVPGIFHTI